MDVAYFEILPEEGLNVFYFWKSIDGKYMKDSNENEESTEDGEALPNKKDQKAKREQPAPAAGKRMLMSKASKKKLHNYKKSLKDDGRHGYYSDEQLKTLLQIEKSVNLPVEGPIEPEETSLKRTAYESDSIIENMGTIFVIAELFILSLAIILLLRVLCFPLQKIRCFKHWYQAFHDKVFWGIFLRFGLEAYIEVAIAT